MMIDATMVAFPERFLLRLSNFYYRKLRLVAKRSVCGDLLPINLHENEVIDDSHAYEDEEFDTDNEEETDTEK